MNIERFCLVGHLKKQKAFSIKTFGPGERVEGVLDHIGKEILEVRANPSDVLEWVDIILLAFDGALRAGYSPMYIEQVVKDQCATTCFEARKDVPLDVSPLVNWLNALKDELSDSLSGCFTPDRFLGHLERSISGRSNNNNALCICWVNRGLWAAAGAMSAGISAGSVVAALAEKQAINEKRDWPDWKGLDLTKAIQHSGAKS